MSRNNMLTLMDNFFDEGLRPLSHSLGRITSGTSPLLNVTEYPDKYAISMTIPGIDAAKIQVELDDGVLNISYDHEEKTSTKAEHSGDLIRQEYAHYSFSRSVSLPKNIDADSVEASSENGILTITVSKHPQSQPRKISVNVNK